MYEIKCDVAIIGGGPAGLSAAVAAKKEGAQDVLIVERDDALGGILQQCIHPGFGLNYFKEELTGPEYAGRFEDEARALGVKALLNTMVLEMDPEAGQILCVSRENGMTRIDAGSIVLAMGCRERTRGAIQTPGTRPSGIYTAGTAQRLVNRENEMVGRNVVILGSGDIGMIMARRMTLEGAKVLAVVEIMNYLAGLTRNKVQCLDDFGIPLMLSHTVTDIKGYRRIEGVTVAGVGADKKPIPGTETEIPCDTLLLSVGLIPENELTRKAAVAMSPVTNGPLVNQYMQTSCARVFACGNVVHVNDLVDNVTDESARAGRAAARFALGTLPAAAQVMTAVTGNNVRYLCPHRVAVGDESERVSLFFRVLAPALDVTIRAKSGDTVIAKRKAKRVNPGEMEKIAIDTGRLSDGPLTVEVVKEA
ncbi:NAD(P)/FAD-dependent oxidoreductase [Pseudoramibacter faecis]|uniref:NAD(P)/FAD-dependent oxidoreductase n=1 Tax=Pseudoramibacter faecis TaxID=3108534 RepID=UPI002E75ABAA|nr:NAD(P)/FAD-dependent oxidoreductase [Pseudoramibacter sp. HA2172]